MDKLILKKRESQWETGSVIRIRPKQHKALQEVSKETNMPISVVASEMLAFALENMEVEEDN